MKHFSTFKEYKNFFLAREFIYSDVSKGAFIYSQNRFERWGGRLASPLLHTSDKFLKNIKNPILIAALTMTGIFLTTVVFYPTVFLVLANVAWLLKLTSFTLLESTILGIGLRTLGRLSPSSELIQAWDRKELLAVPIGAEIL